MIFPKGIYTSNNLMLRYDKDNFLCDTLAEFWNFCEQNIFSDYIVVQIR